jgi:hypothetical protein
LDIVPIWGVRQRILGAVLPPDAFDGLLGVYVLGDIDLFRAQIGLFVDRDAFFEFTIVLRIVAVVRWKFGGRCLKVEQFVVWGFGRFNVMNFLGVNFGYSARGRCRPARKADGWRWSGLSNWRRRFLGHGLRRVRCWLFLLVVASVGSALR